MRTWRKAGRGVEKPRRALEGRDNLGCNLGCSRGPVGAERVGRPEQSGSRGVAAVVPSCRELAVWQRMGGLLIQCQQDWEMA